LRDGVECRRLKERPTDFGVRCKPNETYVKNRTLALRAIKECGTLYDGVGSVKRHLECASFAGSFFVFPSKKIFSLSRMPTKARS
jgi:hypothetical protein